MIRLEMTNYNMTITEKQQKYQHYNQVKLINIFYRWSIPSDQKRVMDQAKFTYSHLGKDLDKQTKTREDQGKKQIKAIEDHGKQLVESNLILLKRILISTVTVYHLKNKK